MQRQEEHLIQQHVIVVTPGLIAFGFTQQLFYRGLMEGALKM